MARTSVCCAVLVLLAVVSSVSAQGTAPTSLAGALGAAPANLSILGQAIQAAGLGNSLTNPNLTWTVFAPTNDAFAAAIEALDTTAEELLSNRPLLTRILSYHVVPGVAALSTDLTDDMSLPTLLTGANVTTDLTDDMVYIIGGTEDNRAQVIVPDIAAGRSIVHVIDAVLVPPANETMAVMTPMEEDDATTDDGATTTTVAGTPVIGTSTAGEDSAATPAASPAATPATSGAGSIAAGGFVAVAALAALLM